MTIEFTVHGPPKGKARPRVCRINGKSVAFTPQSTLEYEKLVRENYRAVTNFQFDKNIPLKIEIFAFFPTPKSCSKKLKSAMTLGQVLPIKKPDCDNIIKIILDALNGVAYHDDAQVSKIHFEKIYAEKPCVKVKITNLFN